MKRTPPSLEGRVQGGPPTIRRTIFTSFEVVLSVPQIQQSTLFTAAPPHAYSISIIYLVHARHNMLYDTYCKTSDRIPTDHRLAAHTRQQDRRHRFVVFLLSAVLAKIGARLLPRG